MSKKKENVEERVLLDDLSSLAGEAYQKLQVNLDLANIGHKYKVIAFTSSEKSEGKTTTVGNLASVYAKKGKKIVIMDLDLRRPASHFLFRKPNENGIVDYVAGEINKEDLIKHTDSGVDLIVCGKHTPFPAEVLENEKLEKLINELKEEYDYIFLDCPPILVASDTVIISKLIDGILLVVRQGQTPKEEFAETKRTLENAKINIIGCVMTDCKNSHGSSGYYYNYDGYKY